MMKWLLLVLSPLMALGAGVGELVDELDALMREACSDCVMEMGLERSLLGYDRDVAAWYREQLEGIERESWVLSVGAHSNRYVEGFSGHCFFTHLEEGEGVNFVCDADSFPLPGGIIEAAVVSQVLENHYDPFRVLDEMHRLLKEEGKLFLVASVHGSGLYYSGFSEAFLRRALEERGFVIESVSYVQGMVKRLLQDNWEILRAWESVKLAYPTHYQESFRFAFEEVLPRLYLSLDESLDQEVFQPTYICLTASKR